MRSLREVTGTPELSTVEVEYNGERFIATEAEVRHLQSLVSQGKVAIDAFKVFDKDVNGDEYLMRFRKDGIFIDNFTCNIFRFCSSQALLLIKQSRNINK